MPQPRPRAQAHSRDAQGARRHRHYRHLLAICLALLVSFTLPGPWARLSSLGYLALAATMLQTLAPRDRGAPSFVPYRALGLAVLASGVIWYVTPLAMRGSGIPVLVLWSLFSCWSALRLILTLAQERRVSGDVLQGALAGYLMLGLSGGLIFAALETIQPGSFGLAGMEVNQGEGAVEASRLGGQQVWELNFMQLNYFAFVSLTTTGFGDVLPITGLAQMGSVAIAVAGTFYLAVVMGLLISRFSGSAQHPDDP
jgi:voltage-gated potassium channel